MRTWIVILLGIGCGCGVGIAASWARYGRQPVEDNFALSYTGAYPELEPPAAGQPQPKVSLEHEEYDFGELELNSDADHIFRFSNHGDGTLRLRKGGTTCMKCTLNDLPRGSLEPGESEEVKVSYHAGSSGPFRQTATILTNDALRPRVALVISGRVVTWVRALPADLVFSHLSVGEPATAELRVLAFGPVPLEITGREFLDEETAAHFKLEQEPLEPGDLEKEQAHSGLRLRVTVLPGLPAGQLRQKLRLTTNQEKSPTLEIPIQGQVVSDISVLGPGWDGEHDTLSIGPVKSRDGASRQIFLMVRGPHRHEIEFHAGKHVPEWLQVEFGAPQDVSGGTVVKVPLTITIPPGSPATNHMGTAQAKLGHLTIETTHPTATQLQILLQFLVEN